MKNLRKDQHAFVSIFTVLIIMSVLTLITIGFSNVTRNAEKRALDNQLNTQAFYAAESGINDARIALAADPTLVKNDCQTGGTFTGYNNGLDAGLNVGYTCLLINSQPPDLRFDSVPVEGNGNAKVVPFESSNGAVITGFRVTWTGVNSTPTIPNYSGSYSDILGSRAQHGVGQLGMVRIDLVPTNSLDRGTIIPRGYTFFLYPSQALNAPSGFVTNGTADQGGLLVAQCAAAPCSSTITLGNTIGSSNRYMMRLQALYNPVSVTIDNLVTTSGGTSFQNAQAVVDVTGKANDVYRRVQARLPFAPRGLSPAFAIQTADSLCKRVLAAPAPLGSRTDISGDPACSLINN